jgi:hypothetical protein
VPAPHNALLQGGWGAPRLLHRYLHPHLPHGALALDAGTLDFTGFHRMLHVLLAVDHGVGMPMVKQAKAVRNYYYYKQISHPRVVLL